MHKIHFISGLPRSGSTLLSALLSQNPNFSASITSPVGSLCTALIPKMGSATEFSPFFSEEKRLAILRGVFQSYYDDAPTDQIIFDTNRKWTSRLSLLAQLFPGSRVICCVRDIPSIIDSLERATQRHPTQSSKLIGDAAAGTIYSRADAFMNQEVGIVGLAWCSLREAWFSALAKMLIVVPYDVLAARPEQTMKTLYSVLGEQSFAHDFENVAFSADEFDANAGTPGLHTVKSRVTHEKRELTIPPDIAAKYADTSFWLSAKLNRHGVHVLC
jgi:sulfotransferase